MCRVETNPEHLFIVGTRRVLQWPIATVAKSPSSNDGKTMGGGLAERIGDFVPLRRVRGHVHEPVGVETIGVERDPI